MNEFTVIYSNRRTICAEVASDGKVTIRAPRFMPKRDVLQFVESQGLDSSCTTKAGGAC